jgi:hypothetical protein
MSVFLFEFATCAEDLPEHIAVEGLAMFKSLYSGFIQFTEVNSFLNRKYVHLFSFDPSNDWNQDFAEYVEKCDYSLIIAPEDDRLLHDLTQKAEKASKNLGSSSKAIEVTMDKWRMYKELKGKVMVPETSKNPLDGEYIVKPRVSCGGENIRFGGDVEDGFIAQRYVNGQHLSVSLIVGDDIHVLSVNQQILEDFRYTGAIVPAGIAQDAMKTVAEEAVRAVECIKGLFGYVGVDVVLSDEQPYIIEINARATTPCVAIPLTCDSNLAELIYLNFYKESLTIPDYWELKRRIMLVKSHVRESPESANAYISVGKSSIQLFEVKY